MAKKELTALEQRNQRLQILLDEAVAPYNDLTPEEKKPLLQEVHTLFTRLENPETVEAAKAELEAFTAKNHEHALLHNMTHNQKKALGFVGTLKEIHHELGGSVEPLNKLVRLIAVAEGYSKIGELVTGVNVLEKAQEHTANFFSPEVIGTLKETAGKQIATLELADKIKGVTALLPQSVQETLGRVVQTMREEEAKESTKVTSNTTRTTSPISR